MRKSLWIACTVFLVTLPFICSAQEVFGGKIVGVITPVVEEFVSRVLEKAEREGVQGVIFLLDTPGGLMESMR
ncbi:MAG: hypothetical protein ABDK93_08230, partial [Atribacterota bacterium]